MFQSNLFFAKLSDLIFLCFSPIYFFAKLSDLIFLCFSPIYFFCKVVRSDIFVFQSNILKKKEKGNFNIVDLIRKNPRVGSCSRDQMGDSTACSLY